MSHKGNSIGWINSLFPGKSTFAVHKRKAPGTKGWWDALQRALQDPTLQERIETSYKEKTMVVLTKIRSMYEYGNVYHVVGAWAQLCRLLRRHTSRAYPARTRL